MSMNVTLDTNLMEPVLQGYKKGGPAGAAVAYAQGKAKGAVIGASKDIVRKTVDGIHHHEEHKGMTKAARAIVLRAKSLRKPPKMDAPTTPDLPKPRKAVSMPSPSKLSKIQ